MQTLSCAVASSNVIVDSPLGFPSFATGQYAFQVILRPATLLRARKASFLFRARLVSALRVSRAPHLLPWSRSRDFFARSKDPFHARRPRNDGAAAPT